VPGLRGPDSPGNYQGWVRLAEKGQQMDEAARTWTAKHIAREYGADPNSADYHHFGRLPGLPTASRST